MKLRYILSALILCAAVACQETGIEPLAEIQVSESFLSIGVGGGQTSLDVTATDAWEVDPASVPAWLTVSPASGGSGTTRVVFSAPETKSTNAAEVKFNCLGKTQYVNVLQFAQKAEPVTMSVAQAIEVIKPLADKEVAEGTYRVKGIVCNIVEISPSYGNATFYISDDGTMKGSNKNDCNWLQVYRGKWLNGDDFKTGNEFAIGDELTIEGAIMDYGGIPETQQGNAYVIKLKKSLVSATPLALEAPKEGGIVTTKVVATGDGLEFDSDSDWLSVAGMAKQDADTTVVSILVSANDADARTGNVTFRSSKGKDASAVAVTVSQAAGFSAFPLPYEETFLAGLGGWEVTDAAIWTNSEKYGMVAKKGAADLVSPNIDLSGVSSAVLTFEHVQRDAANVWSELKLFVSVDNGENWSEVLIPAYSTGEDWKYVPSGEISLLPFAGNIIKLKFQFAGPEATWEIKNLKIVEGVAKIESVAAVTNATVVAETAWSGTFKDAVVSYVNGNNAFIEDATGGTLLYKKDHGLKVGQVINGEVSGKVKLYNGFSELTDIDVSKATVTDAEAPAPTVLTIAELLKCYLRYQNCQVMLEKVTFDTALTKSNRSGVISQGGATVAAYAQIKEMIEMSGTGNLICWPSRYNANLQVGVWDNAHWATE